MGNLKPALRSLLATPLPALVVVVTLMTAIGANTAIFSVVNGVLLRPLGYGDEHGLVVLWGTNESEELFRLSPADYRDVRDDAASFDGQVALYRFIGSTLTGLDEPVRVGTLTVTPRLFSVLRAKPAAGSLFSDEDEKPGGGRKVVLTHASWTRRFGADPALVGGTIELDGVAYTVVGVAEEGFQFPPGSEEVEAYFPMALSDGILLDRDHRMFDAMARLGDGVAMETAEAELGAIAARLAREFPASNQGWRITTRPLREEILGDLGSTLWLLAGAVFLVLLTACANIVNVLIARSVASSRELAVRAALGAQPGDLAARSLAESAVLGLVGGTGGVLLAWWGVQALRALLPAEIPRAESISVDGFVLFFAAALTIGATLLFGALPALRGMAPNLVSLLKPGGALGTALGGGKRLREGMVVVEVALAVVLLVGAGLMVRSFSRISEIDPGFRQEGVVSVAIQLPSSRYGRNAWRPFFEQLVERIRELPGVTAAGAVSDLPMSSVGLGFEQEFTLPGLDAKDPSARPNADLRMMVPGYFDAMDMEIVQGRAFDTRDADAERYLVIVNETVVRRYFGEVDPVGRSLRMESLGEVEIVGVVEDVRHGGLLAKHESEIFLPYGRLATSEMHVVVHSDLDKSAVAAAVGDVLAEKDAQLAPSEIAAIEDLLWASAAQPRFYAALLAGLALCAAFLAAIGTYGLVAYSVSQRTGEIGVRRALGADAWTTVAMVVRQALAIVLVGAALGVTGAVVATRFLGGLLVDIEPTDPLTYALVLAAAMVVAVLAALLPARRATRIDPVMALRAD